MKRTVAALVIVLGVALASWSPSAQQRQAGSTAAPAAQSARAQAIYFPDRLAWQHKRPDEVGMNAALWPRP
jgi:hypothetical protein